MTYQEHLIIAKAIRDAADSFAPNDRLAYHAAFYSVTSFVATALAADNPDEFRRELFMRNAGIETVQDQRERMRAPMDERITKSWEGQPAPGVIHTPRK